MNASKLQRSIHELQESHDDHGHDMRVLVGEVDALIGERVAIAQILADFYRAELSPSACLPVLDLAIRLNPSLSQKLSIVKEAEAV